jgi:hypothetical protein
MSRAAVLAVIEAIADDLLTLAGEVLENDAVGTNDKIGRNTLRDSALKGDLEAAITLVKGEDPVIQALFNHYVVYLEWTRPPKYKRQPPISVLKEWAKKNDISTEAETLWAISYAIWRDGHKGRPIFATMDKALDGLFFDKWADRLHDAILTELNEFFN